MSSQNPIKKTHQVTLTFRFTVNVDESAIPTEGVNASPAHGGTRTGSDEAWHESDERERRLFHAVLAQENTTKAYLLYEVVGQISGWTWQEWHEMLRGIPEENTDQILAPAIKTLPQEDRRYFARAKKDRVFYEATDIFTDCWSSRLDSAEISIDESPYDPSSH